MVKLYVLIFLVDDTIPNTPWKFLPYIIAKQRNAIIKNDYVYIFNLIKNYFKSVELNIVKLQCFYLLKKIH